MRTYVQLSSLLFGLTTLGHILRVLARWPLIIAGRPLQPLASIIVALVAGSMTLWGWRLLSARRRGA